MPVARVTKELQLDYEIEDLVVVCRIKTNVDFGIEGKVEMADRFEAWLRRHAGEILEILENRGEQPRRGKFAQQSKLTELVAPSNKNEDGLEEELRGCLLLSGQGDYFTVSLTASRVPA